MGLRLSATVSVEKWESIKRWNDVLILFFFDDSRKNVEYNQTYPFAHPSKSFIQHHVSGGKT